MGLGYVAITAFDDPAEKARGAEYVPGAERMAGLPGCRLVH